MSKYLLEQLLGSRLRVKVTKFLFRNEGQMFNVKEVAKRIQESRSSVMAEVRKLAKLGLIKYK